MQSEVLLILLASYVRGLGPALFSGAVSSYVISSWAEMWMHWIVFWAIAPKVP